MLSVLKTNLDQPSSLIMDFQVQTKELWYKSHIFRPDPYVQTHLSGWPVISLDALRAEMGISPEENQGPIGRRAREMAREYLRQQQNFVWNATNITRQMRHGLIDLFATYHARVRIIYVEVPWSELLKRNQRRSRPIPVKVIRKLADQLDVPDLSEAHQIDYLESA